MASLEKQPTEEDASRDVVADLAINLADQLIDAFQQDTSGVGDGAGEATPCPTQETASSMNGAAGDGNSADAKDGDGEWQEMATDDDETGEEEDGTKEDEAGEGNSASWASPIGSHGFTVHDDRQRGGTIGDGNDVFTPARVLNFDDSDGDDTSALDQRYIPRGIFIQSDFMDNRPELHGSEEADMFAASAGASSRMNPAMGDQTQNVRIIEGHDDLDLDRGTAYMSLGLRNNFLQTQMVQLPPSSADDFHSQSANLYDSLEREDQDCFPEDDSRECQEDDMEDDRESTNGEEVDHSRDVYRPPFSDRNMMDENLDFLHGGGYVYAGQQYSGRGLLNFDAGEQGDGQAWNAEGSRRSPTRNLQAAASDSMYADKDPRLDHVEGDASSHQPSLAAQNTATAGVGSSIVITLPTQTTSNTSLNQSHSAPANAADFKENQDMQLVRLKNMHPSHLRGGPAGKGGGASAAGTQHSQQPCPRLNRSDQRVAGAGSQNAVRNRVGVGSSGSGRQVTSGAQRPAVQGAAVAAASSGDGDGAVAGDNDNQTAAGAHSSAGQALPSRTSSQGSIHSTTSNNSNNRVSGVGKESNNNHNPQRMSKNQPSKPADQIPAGASARGMQQPPQRQQQQPSHPSQRSQLPARSGQQPLGKRATGAAAKSVDSRVSQLQQQRSQLQQEQQMLQQRQKQLQQLQQQQQQQQHLSGMDFPDGDNLVHHHPDAVVTQLGQMQKEMQRQERDGRSNMSLEVQGMEEVRSRLQSMLRVPRDAAAFDPRAFDFADSASDVLMERPPQHLHDGDSSSLSGYRGQDEMPDLFENFPSFSHKMFSDMSSLSVKSDMSTHSENVYLRDCLEKERYRRKHCEQQIQALNGKLLEVQQQLAVAVSTDKRKDIMIDQLDKQLAKVVEGWKKREADKDEYMRMIMKEKSHIEETLHRQQAMIDSFERDLASTVEELKQEKENSAAIVENMKFELSAAVHDKQHADDLLQAEKERVTLMEQEWEQLKESRDLAEKRAQQAQERLHTEQDGWYQREQELLHKIDQVKDANLKVMQMERVKLEEQTKKAEELEEKVHMAETEVKRLEMEVDSAVREKESLKVEMAITEAKFESAQRSLEADLHAQMEREIAEQLNDVHEKMRVEQEEQAEKHRRMVSELHQRHQKDLEKQLSALRQETHHKEEDHRQQTAELESRLNEYRQENTSLKQAKQKLESQRMEVLTKLQFIMQSQWNEAVSLLVSTPQRRNLNSAVISSLGLTSSSLFVPNPQGAVSQSAGPQFNVRTSSLSASAASDSARTDNVEDRKRIHRESSGHNNLSVSASASCQSSPPRSQQNIPFENSSPSAVGNGISTQNSSSPPRVSAGASGPIFTLADISSLLSHGGQPPVSFTNTLHGVLHSGGVVVQTQTRDKQMQQPQQQQPQHFQPHEDHRDDLSTSGLSVSSEPRAIMIRPPQQMSHPAGERGGATFSRQFQEDFSFLSTSDISHDFSHLSRDLNGLHPGGGSDQESVRSMESSGWPQRFQTDKRLELQDLELGPHGGMQNGWLGQNSGHHSDGGRSEDGSHLPAGAAYSPSSRNQSMSPPVKQGRDGKQEAEGGILHESDRLNSSYREISRQLEEHQARQRELQHYIKMLLDKPPHEQPERDGIVECESLEVSMETVDLDLTDAAQAAQVSTELLRLQQLRDRQHRPQEAVPQSTRPKVTQRRHESSQHTKATGGARSGAATQSARVLGPQQIAKISRLLGQYSEDVETGNPVGALTSDPASVTQLLTLLASLPQQQGHTVTEERCSTSNKTSPRGNPPRRPRDPNRSKKTADVRHHSVGPDGSLSSSVLSDKHDKAMASSTKSTSSHKSDKKSTSAMSANTTSSSAKQSVRPLNKEKPPQAWK